MSRLWKSPGATALVFAFLVISLSVVGLALPHTTSIGDSRGVTDSGLADSGTAKLESGEVAAGGDVSALSAQRSGAGATGGKSGAQMVCQAGRNGGATDVGVTGTKIKLASTVVLSGPGASFLADSPKAIQAVVARVNREGGICGRTLDLTVRDDGWKSDQGLLFLKNFIESKQYFAFPVVPSSEGLTAAIKAGEISKAGIPVIGSDGMLIDQYKDPWVWPVATATVSSMRVMAKYGYDKGARSFGIVYDSQYKFGVEGAAAFADYIGGLSGAILKAKVGIKPAESSYNTEVQKFNGDCKPCDMTVMLLEPATAETWIAGRPNKGKLITSGAQTLFNRRFASNCRTACQGMLVWTGYNPPIDALASLPGVAKYVNDIKAIDPGVDTSNAFAQGAYLGMSAFVEALRQVGPNLTRQRLQQVLNTMKFKSDLSSDLGWSATNRYANTRAQAFSLQYAGDSFSGFANEQTGWIADPKPGG